MSTVLPSMAIWFVEGRGGLPRPQTEFVFSEAAYELVLFGFVPLFLTVATVWILWHVSGRINPDEITDIQSLLIFRTMDSFAAKASWPTPIHLH